MARHSRKHKSRRVRGGAYPLNPATYIDGPAQMPSVGPKPQLGGNSYVQNVVGDMDAQYARVFSQGGQFGNVPGNLIIGTSGQGVAAQNVMPTSQQLAMAQNGGRRGRRGGFLGPMLNQAATPLALLAMQQRYGSRKRKSSSRNRRYSRRFRR
jgi:hypothetical protein